jgi:hypothetical protein
MKKYIIGFMSGLFVCGIIGVSAATYLYHADEVSFTPKNAEWNVDDVESALTDLYDRCESLKETTLWTNPNTSNVFAAQTVVLSQSMKNFKYIKIYYNYYDNYPEGALIIPVDDFYGSYVNNNNTGKPYWSFYSRGNDVNNFRFVVNSSSSTPSETTVYFGNRIYVANGTSSTNNDRLIPTRITGLK